MKLTNWVAIALGVVPHVLANSPQLSIVELDKSDTQSQTISYNQAWIYLARKFGIDEYVSLGEVDEATIDMINNQQVAQSTLPKLILTIDGFVGEDFTPSYKVDSEDSHSILTRISTIVNKYQNYNKIDLSPEFTLFSNTTDIPSFDSTTAQWIEKQEELELLNEDYNNYNDLEPSLKLINDGFFKHEMIQLTKLQHLELNEDILLGNLHCLLSLGKKIDFDSASYLSAKQTLVNVLNDLKEKYDITLLVTDNTEEKDFNQFSKRNAELAEVFQKSSSGCFSSEDACIKDTNSCSSHGTCIKSKLSDCWSCKCQATVDKSKRTQYWAGATCSKQDISSQANLLFWTGLGLVLLMVGGVQFLYSVGNEKLPGILDAATAPKKN